MLGSRPSIDGQRFLADVSCVIDQNAAQAIIAADYADHDAVGVLAA